MSSIATILIAVISIIAFFSISLWIGNREYEERKEARRKRQRNMSPKERQLDDAYEKLDRVESRMRSLSRYIHPTDPFMDGNGFSHMYGSAQLEHEQIVERVREAEEDVFGYAVTPKDDRPEYP